MLDLVVMHVVENKSDKGKKIYRSVLLRESYREGGKVKKRTIANLSHCTPGEIAAVKLALKHKDDLSCLGAIQEDVQLEQGLSVGAVWAVYQVSKRLGIDKALGGGIAGKLALWQVIARTIAQGSRLSAVRLAQNHAACEILQITQGFNEDTLYENLAWLADNQQRIEDKLFSARRGKHKCKIFLYDVTSSYLEGEKNFFGAYGYNRDGKKGKKQIVVGLLCDENGDPVSTEVFSGNTQDPQSFAIQVQKVAKRFGCEQVTFVGDRGMIKSAQIEGLPKGFYYITAITKPQIRSLMNNGVIQFELFDENLCEVEDEGVRYILRRNPIRADEIERSRVSKVESIKKILKDKNQYLKEHKRAKVDTAIKEITKKIGRLKIDKWLCVKAEGRTLDLHRDEDSLKEVSCLDGCYVIKTDLPEHSAAKDVVHDRYKDLTLVEKAFRTCKTSLLEVRPVYVRTEKSTKGHLLVVMLAYMIVRYLQQAWKDFDLTVEDGLKQLSTLCSMKIKVKNHETCLKIPKARDQVERLLKAVEVKIPAALPYRNVPVVTRKKLTDRRKNS